MTINGTRLLLKAALALVLLCKALGTAAAAPLDFTTFEVDWFPQTNGPLAEWITTPTEATIDDDATPNASVNVFYGPDSSIVNKRITGTLTPGTDDDPIGFVLGFMPGDADFFNFPDVLSADYLLIDWKGVDQTYDFQDSAGSGISFHTFTLGGDMPVGLALSRVTGIPTADELWQHVDSPDNPDGGVEELARGATLGSTAYPRDDSSVAFDIRYSSSNITVLVDGVEQFNVDGDFPDGHFGLYSLNQGPSAIWSDFEIFDLADPLTATIDRDTGNVEITNNTGAPVTFDNYLISSPDGGLNPDGWTTISGNYDTGGAGSIDSDPWVVVSSDPFELAEGEESQTDGATLAAGQSIDLGSAWTPSPFESVLFEFELPSGDILPVDVQFTNGPGGQSLQRSDLNADGVIDQADWMLFFPNALADLSGFSPVQAYLRGDLDGDLDNDVLDFGLFKSDFELANGAGSFAAMTGAGVPEPPTLAILALAGCLVFLRRSPKMAVATVKVAMVAIAVGHSMVCAQPVDFTQFTLERYPSTDGFNDAEWFTTSNTAMIDDAVAQNASANVLYGPDDVINKRIRGFLEPGTDDDMVGIVLGFQPGDASFGPDSADADFLLLDWKGVDQDYNFADPPGAAEDFNNLTGSGPAPAGLALSRVTGLANADELWQHANLPENDQGGVEELARGLTLGRTPYDRTGDTSPPVELDIVFTPNQMVVRVDGVLQFNEAGSFSDGRLGMYTGWQGPTPTFSDFEVLDLSTLETVVLSAVVDRATGDIDLTNNTPAAIDLDYYQLDSSSGSLRTSWQGLADGETGAEADPGVGWVEAGAASENSLAELFLIDSSGASNAFSLASGASVTLSGAYNPAVDGQDLLLQYRFPDGTVDAGIISYVGEPSGAIPGDYNASGSVEQGDLDLVLLNWGEDAANVPASWTNDLPMGSIDQEELDGVLLNWGNTAGAVSLGAGSVPEPTTLALFTLLALPLVLAAAPFDRKRPA